MEEIYRLERFSIILVRISAGAEIIGALGRLDDMTSLPMRSHRPETVRSPAFRSIALRRENAFSIVTCSPEFMPLVS